MIKLINKMYPHANPNPNPNALLDILLWMCYLRHVYSNGFWDIVLFILKINTTCHFTVNVLPNLSGMFDFYSQNIVHIVCKLFVCFYYLVFKTTMIKFMDL